MHYKKRVVFSVLWMSVAVSALSGQKVIEKPLDKWMRHYEF